MIRKSTFAAILTLFFAVFGILAAGAADGRGDHAFSRESRPDFGNREFAHSPETPRPDADVRSDLRSDLRGLWRNSPSPASGNTKVLDHADDAPAIDLNFAKCACGVPRTVDPMPPRRVYSAGRPVRAGPAENRH